MPAVPPTQDNLEGILASLGQAAFVWDIAGDTITWSGNAAVVFSDIPGEALASATEFSKLIEPSRSIRTASGANRASAYVVMHGVIQHDLYHAGQIAVLKKGIRP